VLPVVFSTDEICLQPVPCNGWGDRGPFAGKDTKNHVNKQNLWIPEQFRREITVQYRIFQPDLTVAF